MRTLDSRQEGWRERERGETKTEELRAERKLQSITKRRDKSR